MEHNFDHIHFSTTSSSTLTHFSRWDGKVGTGIIDKVLMSLVVSRNSLFASWTPETPWKTRFSHRIRPSCCLSRNCAANQSLWDTNLLAIYNNQMTSVHIERKRSVEASSLEAAPESERIGSVTTTFETHSGNCQHFLRPSRHLWS